MGNLQCRHVGHQRVLRLQRAPHLPHRPTQQADGTAGVVGVAMAEHQGVQPCFAPRAQQRPEDAVARVRLRRPARPGVVDQQVRLRAQQHRRALSHVRSQQIEAAGGR
ncbi:hypothetical protein RZS08_49550, partial [Arthrospira platensis SPKY1]|nr:hypothetical protein [Arthrospira platensis SPKY1]